MGRNDTVFHVVPGEMCPWDAERVSCGVSRENVHARPFSSSARPYTWLWYGGHCGRLEDWAEDMPPSLAGGRSECARVGVASTLRTSRANSPGT